MDSVSLIEFDEEIFNALVEKIEILTPAYFVFEYEIGGLAKCNSFQNWNLEYCPPSPCAIHYRRPLGYY